MKKTKFTALVSGGAGFLGSHLCDLLVRRNIKVICIDNLITGSEENIKHLYQEKEKFIFLKYDISVPFTEREIKKIGSVSHIFHLASPASPVDYWKYPEETLLVNSLGTLNLLNIAKSKNAKFLLASTSEIYGDPKVHPQPESYFGNVNTFGPRSCYDESKRFAESATYVYLHKYGVDARIVRIFNTYGPRMQVWDGRVISNFINNALRNSDIKIDGDGSQTRSFCYVSDLIDGIEKAMFAEKTKGEIFNLGNPKEFTILDLAKKVIDLTGSGSEIVFSGSFRRDDPMRRKPDIKKAGKILKWKPEVSLDEGLKITANYYSGIRENSGQSAWK